MFSEGESDRVPSPPSKLQLYKQKAIFVLIIVAVLALGLLAVNQFIGFRYKMVFTQTPCDLCTELNPHLEKCFLDSSVVYKTPHTFNTELKDLNLSYLEEAHPS